MEGEGYMIGGVNMEEQLDNIILFPKWKRELEAESLQALKEKRYAEALEKLDQLIAYHEDNQEIFVGKLICLMELARFQEAQELAEDLLSVKSEGYFDYMHIYLTILFQTNQYDLLIETVEQALQQKDMPLTMKEQYQQLYAISQNMRSDLTDKQSKEDFAELQEAVAEGNHLQQWRLVERLRKTRLEPNHAISDLLEQDNVHPVTKTAILLWLRDWKEHDPVCVTKMGRKATIIPSESADLKTNGLKAAILQILQDYEQSNPTVYQMMIEVLDRYLYVMYPFIERELSASDIANAIIGITSPDEADMTAEQTDYIEEINTCQALYLTILES